VAVNKLGDTMGACLYPEDFGDISVTCALVFYFRVQYSIMIARKNATSASDTCLAYSQVRLRNPIMLRRICLGDADARGRVVLRKSVLIMQLRPEDDTADDEYRAFLQYAELEARETMRLRIERRGIPSSLEFSDYSAIIVGGSPFDISTPEAEKAPIQKRIEADFSSLLKEVVARDFPFFGACSGNGLLGSYLGTRISRQYGEPVGCFPVHLTEEGRRDPLLAGFPDTIQTLLGHKEACDEVPDGATLLIKGEVCPVQMFRVGRNVYATQFHPEGDPLGFTTRIQAYRHHGYFEPHQADALIERVRCAQTPYAQEILRRFVARYTDRGATKVVPG